MKKLFLLIVVVSLTWVAKLHATTFAIDSLDGDITANELKQFTNSIKTITPPVNNYGDNMSTHGTEVEGMARMYEATGDMNILNRLIFVMDIALVHRNDEPLGEHRVMWTGNVEPGWPENSTNTTPACSSGQIHGNIAYCARLILETPSIWNLTVPDGNPYGYGVTYKQRAQGYLAKVDQGLSQYTTVWFVDPNTFKIHTPSDPRWSPASSHDTAETAWNRQALFVMAYQHAAECHDILGDNPSFLPLYKGVVNKFSSWFTTAYPGGGSLYYTNNGVRVAKWYYQIPTDQHIENQGHAQHDMIGLYQGWESGYTGVTDSQMKVYADTTQFIINLGATNSWADNVDGTGSSSYLKSDFMWLAQWNPALYKMIGQAIISGSQLNSDEGCKNTAYILWMKHWFFMQQAQDFTIAATPSSRTVPRGSSTTYTISTSAINGFNSSIGFTVSGLPAGATATFSPSSVTGSGTSTLTVTTSTSTPAGSSTLTITANGGGRTHTTSVSLIVADFTISATPSSQSVVTGDTATYTVNLGSVNGFNSAVSLAVSGLPAGATATFNPASVTPVGSATLTVTTSASTPLGTSTLTITGTSGSLAHSITVSLSVTAPPDFTLSATPASQTVSAGSGTTYTATISALNGFSGAVSFSVSGLPTGATATFNPASVTGSGSSTVTVTTSALTPVGSYTLTITGTSGSLAHSTTVSLSVTAPPDFTISATPASQTVSAGSGTTYTATISALNGFSGAVNLTVSGLPAGAGATFNPASVTGSGSSTVTVTTSALTPVGSYTLTITGTSGSLVHSTTVSLSVTAPPDFTISTTPASQTVSAGSGTTYTATIGALNGFGSAVSFSVSGLPAGATATFNPTSVTGSGSSTVTVTTSASTPVGSYTLTITGTSGSLTHSATVTLSVTAPPDFTLSASPSSQTVTAGNNTNYTATLGALNGFGSAVNLSVSGLPSGATASFNPASVTGSGSSTLTVTTTTSTPAGTYTLTLTGTSGSLSHSATVTLVVNAAVVTWTTVNDTGAGISYSAGWSYSTNRAYGDLNSDVHYTKTNANWAQFTFTGTGVRYITETYSDEGNVDIYIDGILQTTVNCNTATRQAQVVVYAKTGLSAGTHTIKIVKSSGTYMVLDAFAYTP